jgi:hypothetical protein
MKKIKLSNIVFYLVLIYFFIFNIVTKSRELGRQSLDGDEIVSLQYATHATNYSLLTGQFYDNGNPPLHFIFLKNWIGMVGKTEAATRVSSVIFFLIGFIFCVLVSKDQLNFSKRQTILVAGLYSTSAFLYAFSRYGRPYSLTVLLSLIIFYFLNKYIETKHNLLLLGLSILSITIGLYTHYSLVFFLAFLFLSELVARFKNFSAVKKLILVYFSSALLYLPWIIFFIKSQFLTSFDRFEPYQFWQVSIPWLGVIGWSQLLTNFIFKLNLNDQLNTLITIAIFVVWAIFAKKEVTSSIQPTRKIITVLVFTTFFVLAASPIHYFISMEKYFIFIASFSYIQIVMLFHRGVRGVIGQIFVFVVIILMGYHLNNYQIQPQDYRGISAYLDSLQTDNALIIVNAYYLPFQMDYYYHGSLKILDIDTFEKENSNEPSAVYFVEAKWVNNPAALEYFLNKGYAINTEKTFPAFSVVTLNKTTSTQ